MADPRNEALDDDAGIDERKLARIVGFALPLATCMVFAVITALFGLAPGILVLIGGTLLGVIALLWGSLRVLSGDAPLPPEIEALDAGAHAVDQLAVRKTMLLRALKDLDNERALGKLDAEDHEAVASTYRADLKDVLRQMDEQLAPYRADADKLASAHLAKKGLLEGAAAPAAPPPAAASEADVAAASDMATARATCPACAASNEPDARFCKACGAAMTTETTTKAKTEEPSDEA